MSESAPHKVVLDHNIIVSGVLFPRGNSYDLLEAWRAGRFVLVTTPALRAELEEVLRRERFARKYGLTPAQVEAVLILIDTTALMVSPASPLPVQVRDPKDDSMLAAALGSGADYLVTGDKDLLDLGGDPRLDPLKIMTPAQFLREPGFLGLGKTSAT